MLIGPTGCGKDPARARPGAHAFRRTVSRLTRQQTGYIGGTSRAHHPQSCCSRPTTMSRRAQRGASSTSTGGQDQPEIDNRRSRARRVGRGRAAGLPKIMEAQFASVPPPGASPGITAGFLQVDTTNIPVHLRRLFARPRQDHLDAARYASIFGAGGACAA